MAKKFIFIFLFVAVLSVVLCQQKQSIKQIQVIFRHGARTPTELYKNDPNTIWKEGLGQLTNNGKNQMYLLGAKLRETYKDILSDFYSPEDVYVLSSQNDRARMSAELVSAGLFPPVNDQIWNPSLIWQPIPVNYLLRVKDNLIAMKRPCAAFKEEFRKASNSVRIQNINTLYRSLFAFLTNNTGSIIDSIGKVESLYSTLSSEKECGRELPDWVKNMSPEKWKIMHTLAAENLALYSSTDKMTRLQGGPLLSYITSTMIKRNATPTNNTQAVLISGHDITIVSLMKTMGFDNLLKPGYGAYAIFELYNSDRTNEIRFLYSNDYTSFGENLDIPFCPRPCYLEDFVKNGQLLYPSNWQQECEAM